MFIIHSFALAGILYFVLARKDLFFERLLFLCVGICLVQSLLIWLVPVIAIPNVASEPNETRFWLDPAAPGVEAARITLSFWLNMAFHALLVGFIIFWFKVDPLKACAIVGAYMAYQLVLGFILNQFVLLLSTTRSKPIGF
ncbi:hypothetical protein DB346_16270 [Verrucomicrobia bacterium LW23]|nr:hypothetical protein DB346_16270 [Verrucomicrobia bacterium LW23]